MTFPLLRCPGGVVFLDDDEAWIEMLADVMPEHWPVSLYLHPSGCIRMLQQQGPLQEADDWRQRDILDRWRDGRALIPQILQYWREDQMNRHALIRVCVVDYSMPAMNGLQVLDRVPPWQGARILLTGRADEQIAVDAFNSGLIEQYIPKQSDGISRRLADAIQRRLDEPRVEQALTWRATLSRTQLCQLNQPEISRALLDWLSKERLVEHIVIGDPFGVLALDADGQAWWLQLEMPANLGDLAELAACHDLRPGELDDIRAGRRLANVELSQSLGLDTIEWAAATQFGHEPALIGALFRLPAALCPGPQRSYRQFLQTCDPREPMELSPES